MYKAENKNRTAKCDWAKKRERENDKYREGKRGKTREKATPHHSHPPVVSSGRGQSLAMHGGPWQLANENVNTEQQTWAGRAPLRPSGGPQRPLTVPQAFRAPTVSVPPPQRPPASQLYLKAVTNTLHTECKYVRSYGKGKNAGPDLRHTHTHSVTLTHTHTSYL